MSIVNSYLIGFAVCCLLVFIVILIDMKYNFTHNDGLIIFSTMAVIIIIGCVTGFTIYDPTAEIPEEVDGKYINAIKNNNDIDIEITAKLIDGEVTRTSTYKLKGKDFQDNEIEDTNKAFTKLVRKMLDNRQKTLDSLSNVKPYDKNCKLVVNNNKQYWLCKVNK